MAGTMPPLPPSVDNPIAPTDVGVATDLPLPQTVKLSQDQLAAAGLEDLQPGQTFSVTLHGTVGEVGDGVDFTINDAMDGVIDGTEPEPAPPFQRQGPAIKGPKDAGMKSQMDDTAEEVSQ